MTVEALVKGMRLENLKVNDRFLNLEDHFYNFLLDRLFSLIKQKAVKHSDFFKVTHAS